MSQIAVVGLGVVGIATAVAFAKGGHSVRGVDVDQERVTTVNEGRSPVYDPGLEGALRAAVSQGQFSATSVTKVAAQKADLVFLAVGTPSRPDGSMDDAALRQATQAVATALPEDSHVAVVVKSTVTPGTTEAVIDPLLEASGRRYGLAVNPEFLREGRALEDALHPDRIVLGTRDADTRNQLRALYAMAECPIVETSLRSAELIKYATNALLATKVTFANELANLCQALGVAYEDVIPGVGLDPRISPRFLVPGVGFGGSCFPKDVRALVAATRDAGYTPALLEAVLGHNEVQYLQAIRLLEKEVGDLTGKRVALLGLAFKGNTDDVRESRAIPIARTLLEKGADVIGYDPKANENFRSLVPEFKLASSAYEALKGAQGCILQADWPEFTRMEAKDFLETMKTPVVVDGRRILDPAKMEGVRFRRIGAPRVLS